MNWAFQLVQFPVSPIQFSWCQRSVHVGCHECWLLSKKHAVRNIVKRIYTGLEQHQETSSQELLHRKNHGSIIMMQRPNKIPCNGNTRGLLFPRTGKIMATVFFGTRCSAFGINTTQDNNYWRYLCFHNGGFTWEYQTETPWKVVGWCSAASWQCTRTYSTSAVRKCDFVKLNHPPYSPDLAPSDYFLS